MIEHDRFGSIRQQVWTLLHYLLHVAILLTVEGQTALITWTSCRNAIEWFEAGFPSLSNPASLGSTPALVATVNRSLTDAAARYHYTLLSSYYDSAPDMAALQNVTYTGQFGTAQWNTTASQILSNIQYNVEYFLFMNFQAEGPEEEITATKDYREKVNLLNGAFEVVFEYFFIAAGGLLITLAVMYWFGKVHKHGDEWCCIILRFAVGAALACVSAVGFLETPGNISTFRYTHQTWIIPIVTFCFFGVLVGDNLIKIIYNLGKRGGKRRTTSNRDPEKATGVHANTRYAPLFGGLRTAPGQTNTKQVQSWESHTRNDSQDSESTLTDVNVRGRGGYSTLHQRESIDTHERSKKIPRAPDPEEV